MGFTCYALDHVNMAVAVARLVAGNRADRLSFAVRAVFGLSALVATLAAGIRSWAEAYLPSSVVHDSKLHSDRLVADGPYRHLRNPLYLGTILLALAIGTMASRLGFLVLGAGMWLFTYRLILREEDNLLQSQGESYRRYLEAVPRLLPSLRPRVPAGAARPNWRDGLTGEIFMWGCATGMVAFTATLRIQWFWVFLGAGFAVYFLQHLARRAAKK
jgi:protein-S-isoprenylcysteine O-methyltransferase Ste14